MAEERAAARAEKDWAKADRLRDEITAAGYEVIDAPEGSHIQPIPLNGAHVADRRNAGGVITAR